VSDGDRLGEAKVEVGVVVRDADTMAAFYGDVLGLEEVSGFDFTGGSMRRFLHGDAIVKLVATAPPPELSNPPNGPAGGAAGVRYISVAVDDLDASLERCTAAGGAVPVPKMEFRAGVHIAMVEDPEGNWIELVQSTA
jgi:predicted enzyme related to lactoylglutathione lyase